MGVRKRFRRRTWRTPGWLVIGAVGVLTLMVAALVLLALQHARGSA